MSWKLKTRVFQRGSVERCCEIHKMWAEKWPLRLKTWRFLVILDEHVEAGNNRLRRQREVRERQLC